MVLIDNFLDCPKNLFDCLSVLEDLSRFISRLLVDVEIVTEVAWNGVSKKPFLDRFYTDTKKSFTAVLDLACPLWVYKVFPIGWRLVFHLRYDA